MLHFFEAVKSIIFWAIEKFYVFELHTSELAVMLVQKRMVPSYSFLILYELSQQITSPHSRILAWHASRLPHN